MIYGKLPVAFLGAIAAEKNGSTNSTIAAFILANRDRMRGMGITELAQACHVSPSSISRFCRDTGFDSFAELRELIETSCLAFEPERTPADTARVIQEGISLAALTVNPAALDMLCRELVRCRRAAAFGLLKAQAAAADLQCDMLMMGKPMYTNVSYTQQLDHILSAGPDDLILIFSLTGAYFEYQDLRGLEDRLAVPRIWMITGEEKPFPAYVDAVLSFQRAKAQAAHPYQLQLIASLIAQKTGEKLTESR